MISKDNYKNLDIKVKLEFDCDYFHKVSSNLSKMLKGQNNYEIVYNSSEEKVTVLINADRISLEPEEEIIEVVEDLEELEEVCYWD